MFVLTLLLYCGSHTDCISPCAMATVLVMTSAVSVISTSHCYNSAATTAKPATLLPLLQSLQLYCPSAIRVVGLVCLLIAPAQARPPPNYSAYYFALATPLLSF